MKLYKDCGICFLVGIENQSAVDYSMVTRMMMYDAMNYAAQDAKRRKHKGRKLRKKKKRLPVISCVLYYSYQKRWHGPRTLFEGLKLPTELENFVNNYKIHVIEVAWLSDAERRQLKGNFRILADALYELRTTGTITGSKRRILHVKALLLALSAITGNSTFEKIQFEHLEKETMTMRNLMEKHNWHVNS